MNTRPPHNPVAYAGPAADAPPITSPPPTMPPPSPPVQTPSQAITAAANEIIRVTDRRGRVIGFRRELDVIENYRMLQLLGAAESENTEIRLGYALPAFLSAEIDGLPLPPLGKAPIMPSSRVAFEGRIQLLGAEGLSAILDYWAEASLKTKEEQESAQKDALSAIKN